MKDVVAYYYNEAAKRNQEVFVNDRFGAEERGKHGDLYNVEYEFEKGNTGNLNHKWSFWQGIAKTFVAIDDSSSSLKVDGFYTVSASTIEFESLTDSDRKGLPAYPIPAILIGKLAVDSSAKGQGLGTELLVDALFRAVKASLEVAVFAVRVDAIDSTARDFYLKYEFIPFHDRPLSLFLPIKTIIKEFSTNPSP